MVSVKDSNFKTEYARLLLSMPPLKQTEEELWNLPKGDVENKCSN